MKTPKSALSEELVEGTNAAEFGLCYIGASVRLALEARDFIARKPPRSKPRNRHSL